MSVTLVRGDARRLPLPDRSVDLIVTSPPYFALRSYQDTVECDRCRELRAGWGRRDDHDRNLREAWPDYDAHVEAEHKPAHYAGQIGSEATPGEWVDALIACTREWVRVLKPSGSMFINLGDKYAGSDPGSYRRDTQPLRDSQRDNRSHRLTANAERAVLSRPTVSVSAKSLLGLPWRYALRCIDELGLILRAEIVWSKPNGLPESVTDRVRRSHETWLHFVTRPRYYSAIDTIREPQIHDARKVSSGRELRDERTADGGRKWNAAARDLEWNPLGKLPGSVWSVPSQPLTVPAHLGVDHFAAFPMAWPRRLILGWSPSGICTGCGEGRRPVTDGRLGYVQKTFASKRTAAGVSGAVNSSHWIPGRSQTTITGEVCACTPYTDHPGIGGVYEDQEVPYHRHLAEKGYPPNFGAGTGTHANLSGRPKTGPWREYHEWTPPPTRPAIIVDPFGGTGTTALVADVLGRHGVSVDMSADYCRLAAWRTTDPGERARAMQVDKPEPVPDGQLDLFQGAM